jgi:FixJ family two-component response regulator
VIDPTIDSQLVARKRARGPLDALTEREHEVLTIVAEGAPSNDAMGEELFLSRKPDSSLTAVRRGVVEDLRRSYARRSPGS